MAEWWVDPDNGLETNAGTSASVPWKLIPGQTGATGQTGYAVTAGDTINVKNGSRSVGLRIIVPAHNLTYRGYGLAGNALDIPLPSGRSKTMRRVVREVGTHEGMWTIDGDSLTSAGIVTINTANGTVFEDMDLVAPNATTALGFGTSGNTNIGATLRRSRVRECGAQGLSAYGRQITIEDCVFQDIADDAIGIGASATNSYRAGYKDTIRRVAFIRFGTNQVSAIGDAVQTYDSSDRFESSLEMEDIYCYKETPVKQSFVIADALGGFSLRRFLIEGPETAQGQILFSGLRGNAIVEQGLFVGACASNPAFRVIPNSAGSAMATGSVLTIQSVLLVASRHAGFWNFASGLAASSVDGRVRVYNCYVVGNAAQGLSYSAAVSCHPASIVTYGANAELLVRNCIVGAIGDPAIRLPSGGENDARWKFQNNLFVASPTFVAGANTYSTLAAFEAAHNQATNNVAADDPLLDSSYRPTVNSPCVGAGVYVPGAKHFGGKAMNGGAPDIGAHRYYEPRSVATDRRTRLVGA